MKAQRLRFRYRVTENALSLGNRDIVRAWESAVQAAGFNLAYSEGKRAAPQIAIAAPLPLGVTSGCELAELFLAEFANPEAVLAAVAASMASGIQPFSVEEAGLSAPSLQSRLRWAEYEVQLPAEGLDLQKPWRAVDHLLNAKTWAAEYRRETKVRLYDLRPLVLDIQIKGQDADCLLLNMRLRAEPDLTGRADQVILALGLPPASRIHRRCLYLGEVSPAVLAFRRAGQPDEA